MLITFGTVPHDLAVHLAPDADFVQAIVSKGDPWPVDGTIELRFYPRATPVTSPATATWDATVDGLRAEWHEDKLAVRAVLNANATHVRLLHVSGDGDELLWAEGRVHAH